MVKRYQHENTNIIIEVKCVDTELKKTVESNIIKNCQHIHATAT